MQCLIWVITDRSAICRQVFCREGCSLQDNTALEGLQSSHHFRLLIVICQNLLFLCMTAVEQDSCCEGQLGPFGDIGRILEQE